MILRDFYRGVFSSYTLIDILLPSIMLEQFKPEGTGGGRLFSGRGVKVRVYGDGRIICCVEDPSAQYKLDAVFSMRSIAGYIH